jgi:uncharacterized protein
MEHIEHKPGERCFLLNVENAEAILEYRMLTNNTVDFTHTFVPNQFRGKGLAEKLVKHGLAWAEQQGYAVQASCWYVARFLA